MSQNLAYHDVEKVSITAQKTLSRSDGSGSFTTFALTIRHASVDGSPTDTKIEFYGAPKGIAVLFTRGCYDD